MHGGIGKRRAAHGADVSCVVTNYNTGHLLERCVTSLLQQEIGSLELECIVVDDGSFIDQSHYLATAEQLGARVVQLDRNQGYGRACNHGVAAATGTYVFYVNSDTVAMQGAVLDVVRFLDRHNEAAFVEPRTFVDDERTFLIPEIFAYTPGEAAHGAMSGLSSRWAERVSRERARRWIDTWQQDGPIEQPHLTGAFLGARRAVVEQLSGFDEAYPLFYEDSDLFARAHEEGYRLFLLPSAEVVHYGHRSVARFWEDAMRKARRGRHLYLRRYHGVAAAWANAAMEYVVRRLRQLRKPTPSPPPTRLGTLREPPVFEPADPDRPYLLELAFDPFHLLSCGRFCDPGPTTFSPGTWDSLYDEAEHYMRALALDTLEPLGSWSFTKAPPVGFP